MTQKILILLATIINFQAECRLLLDKDIDYSGLKKILDKANLKIDQTKELHRVEQ